MNPRRTWILVILALALGAFIMGYERRQRGDGEGSAEAQKALPAFDPRSVTSVEVKLGANILRAERTNSEWRLTWPVQYPAYGGRIEGLLPVFSQLNSKSHISAPQLLVQKQPLSAFGLEPPTATVVVVCEDQSRWELKVGGPTLVGKQVYVQLVGREGIYYTDAGFMGRLPRAVADWRDPDFLHLKGLTFNRLEVKTSPGGFEMKMDDSTRQWTITQPSEARANNARIERLLEDLRSWQIARFGDDHPNLDLEAYGLRPQETTLRLAQGTNEVLVAYFGKSPTNDASLVYAYIPAYSPAQPYVVSVPRDRLEYLRAPFTDWRENRLLSVSLANTDMIEVQTPEDKFTLEKAANGGWWIKSPEKVAADADRMRDFFGDISTVNIADYVKDVATDLDNASFGLTPPKRRYVFRSFLTNTVEAKTNQTIAQIDFGAEKDGKVYTRVAGDNWVYASLAEMVDRLPKRAVQLWDRQIWQFTSNDVNSLAITIGPQTHTFVRDAARQWRLAGDPRLLDDVLKAILDEFLFRLGTLRAETWVTTGDDKMKLFGFPENDRHLTVEVTQGGKSQKLTLDLGKLAFSGNLYAATTRNGAKAVFELGARTYQYYTELLLHWPAATSEPPGGAR